MATLVVIGYENELKAEEVRLAFFLQAALSAAESAGA